MSGFKSEAAVAIEEPVDEGSGLGTYYMTVERLAWRAAGGDAQARAELGEAIVERGKRRARHLIAQAQQRARARL